MRRRVLHAFYVWISFNTTGCTGFESNNFTFFSYKYLQNCICFMYFFSYDEQKQRISFSIFNNIKLFFLNKCHKNLDSHLFCGLVYYIHKCLIKMWEKRDIAFVFSSNALHSYMRCYICMYLCVLFIIFGVLLMQKTLIKCYSICLTPNYFSAFFYFMVFFMLCFIPSVFFSEGIRIVSFYNMPVAYNAFLQ
jgi:hypothetical protein